jgi:preprotein translocase subunit SecD
MKRRRVQFALGAAAILAVFSADIAAAETVILDVQSAAAEYDQRTTEPVVTVRFTPAARQAFSEFTRKNVGRRVSLLVDGRVIITTTIREPIDGGVGQLSGDLTVDRAKEIAAGLSSGKSRLEVVNAD